MKVWFWDAVLNNINRTHSGSNSAVVSSAACATGYYEEVDGTLSNAPSFHSRSLSPTPPFYASCYAGYLQREVIGSCVFGEEERELALFSKSAADNRDYTHDK